MGMLFVSMLFGTRTDIVEMMLKWEAATHFPRKTHRHGHNIQENQKN